jgi:hypothetical protein
MSGLGDLIASLDPESGDVRAFRVPAPSTSLRARSATRRVIELDLAKMRDDLTDVRHGTNNGYGNLGCRCSRCRRANTCPIASMRGTTDHW